MTALKPILVIESRPKDLEQTLAALANRALANPLLVARDADEALEFLKTHGGAALVLLDTSDPGGPDTLRRLKDQSPMAPVLALVAPGLKSRVEREHPHVPALTKPLRSDQLLTAVEDLGQALAIVGQAAPRGAYLPKGSRLAARFPKVESENR